MGTYSIIAAEPSETDHTITMTSVPILYDNQTTSHNLSGITNSPTQSAYLLSPARFITYSLARCCQVCVGIPANIITLFIIQRLHLRLNMHIIMVYMAISDILSSATLPMSIYMGASAAQMSTFNDHWDTLCITKTYFDMLVFLGSMLSYAMLSVDR